MREQNFQAHSPRNTLSYFSQRQVLGLKKCRPSLGWQCLCPLLTTLLVLWVFCPLQANLISKKLQPRKEGGLWVWVAALSVKRQKCFQGAGTHVSCRNPVLGHGDPTAGPHLTTEDRCAPLCSLSVCVPRLSQEKQVDREWRSLGRVTTLTGGPEVSWPLPLFLSLCFKCLRDVQTSLKDLGELHKAHPATWGQFIGQRRGLGVKQFYFKCLLIWQLQGIKNPHSGVCAPGGEGLGHFIGRGGVAGCKKKEIIKIW